MRKQHCCWSLLLLAWMTVAAVGTQDGGRLDAPPRRPQAAVAQPAARLALKSHTVRVLALNFDPVLRNHGNVRLSRFMNWNDPRLLTTNLFRHLRESSGGYASCQLVDLVDVDVFPVKRDGFRYDEASYLEMWTNRAKAHQPDSVSYAAIFRQFNLAEKVRQGAIQEVWLWGAPYFGTDEYAMKIPGDRLFYPTENPWFYRPYDIPDCGRTVWVMGFNYEVGEDNALHSFGHRCEGILSLTVGQGVWDNQKNPTNIWNRFTHLAVDFPQDAQVGNIHGGPNAKGGYDYAQTNVVWSAADDWFNYPRLTGARKLVDCDTWGGPAYQLNYLCWWLDHLPRVSGATAGFHNNWWRYIIDYDAAVKELPPPGGRLRRATTATY